MGIDEAVSYFFSQKRCCFPSDFNGLYHIFCQPKHNIDMLYDAPAIVDECQLSKAAKEGDDFRWNGTNFEGTRFDRGRHWEISNAWRRKGIAPPDGWSKNDGEACHILRMCANPDSHGLTAESRPVCKEVLA